MRSVFRFTLVFLLLSSARLGAQTKFQRVFGAVDSMQDGMDIKQTNDGGYIINARVTLAKTPPMNNAAQEDAYILKVSSAGTLQWTKRHAGTSYEEGRGIVQTTDGGYYYAGETKTWSAGGPNDFDAFCTKTDAAGNIQWTRNYGDVWNDGAWTGQQTADGGYMAFGSSSNLATNGYADYYLLKLANNGSVQWSHTFGGSHFDFGYDAVQTSDQGYIMTGGSFSFGSGYSFLTMKCDVNGTFQWGTVLNEFADEYAYGIAQTNDGGYIATGGYTGFGLGSTDVLLVKYTSSGSVSWVKNYGSFQHECGFSVKQTSDGGYAVAGSTNSVGAGGNDLFLMKTDATGTILWTKTYGGTGDEGFTGGMFFSYSGVNGDVGMVNTNDGGFAITAQTHSFGNGHVFMVKTDANGNSDCNEGNGPFFQGVPTMTVTSGGTQTNPSQITGFPNPVVTTPFSKDTNVCCVPPIALAGNDVTICQTASTTLNASGGTSYSWSSGQTASSISVSPASTTTYIVTVSDSCGSDKDTVIVTVNPVPTANAGADVTICPGANVTLSGTGSGSSYSWNPGGQTTTSVSVSPTASTTYTFSSTNSCGTSADSVKITVSSSITANIAGNLTLCPGQSTTLTASGGNNYSWNTGSSSNPIIVSPTASTTYSVLATSGSCSATATASVTVSPAPTASIASSTTICFGQGATLTASGGSTYSWNTGSSASTINVAPTTTSNYSVVASNGGCTDTAVATVTVLPSIIFTVTPASICLGQSATISATGGGTYSWSTGATTSAINITPTSTTSYTVTVVSGVCTGSAVATVNVSSTPTATISGNTTVCAGSNGTLSASGGSTYTWNTGQTTSSLVITPTSATSYSVIVSNGACKDTAYASVSIAPSIMVNIPGQIICSGASATVTPGISGGTAPYTYAWSTGSSASSITVNPTITTNYTITVADAAGCSGSFAMPLTVLAAPNIGVTGNTSVCIGNSTTLTANGGVMYSWSNGSTAAAISVTPTTSTTYTVTGTDGNGCTKAITVSVTISTPPIASITGNDTICEGESAQLIASGGGNYVWNTGQSTSSITVSPTTNTSYAVLVTVGGCTATATYSVAVIPAPSANAGASISITQGESATLSASGGGTYLWNNGMTDQVITVTPTATTQYCVVVTDASGCSDSSCVTVYVEPIDCNSAGPLYLPNAFSPNEDSDNDFLQLYYGNMACIKTFKLTIYDRWGEKVFETEDPLFKWDGVYETKELTTAVFSYYMAVSLVTDPAGSAPATKKGNISMTR